MKKISTHKSKSKWADPEWRREYGAKWRKEQRLKAKNGSATVVAPSSEQKQKWREAAKARKESSQVHPLFLDKCPGCGAEFFRKVNNKYEPMKLDRCASNCSMRFYFAKTVN